MARKFKTVDYGMILKQTVIIEDCLPPSHLARFLVEVISQLNLDSIYSEYGAKGGIAIAPEILLGLLIYGYATGIFSSRKIELATYESIPFRYIAGNLHPDHDTVANFRSRFLEQLKELFVQVLEMAVLAGVLRVEDISVDGTKIHADASKSKAVSHKRLEEKRVQLRMEVEELLQMGQQADRTKVPESIDVPAEIDRRNKQLDNLAEAQKELQHRAQERFEESRLNILRKWRNEMLIPSKLAASQEEGYPLPPF